MKYLAVILAIVLASRASSLRNSGGAPMQTDGPPVGAIATRPAGAAPDPVEGSRVESPPSEAAPPEYGRGVPRRDINAVNPLPAPGFTGSAHDFYGPNAPLEIRCAPCHGSAVRAPEPARWDTTVVRDRRAASAQPRWAIADTTRLCLSCHDGILASEIVGGGHDAGLFATGAPVSPRRDHPVGVLYPRSGRSTREGRSPLRDYQPMARLKAEGLISLPGGRVECISCHDPHAAYGHPAMLVKSNRRSALCLSCHRK